MASPMQSMTEWMQAHVAPIATKLGQNKVLSAISGGMVRSTPLTVGVAAIAIFINLPIPGLTDWLTATGFVAAGNEIVNSTMSLLAIYVSFLIAHQYAKNDGTDPITAGVLSMACFLCLIPSTMTLEDGTAINTYAQNYLGSDGIFVALILSVCVTAFYGFLTRKNIKLSLPDSVPPMVADSLSPIWSAMIIFVLVLLMKVGFTHTPFGNVFDFVKQVVSAPLMIVGSSPWTAISIFTLANLVWFFGIHPNTVMSLAFPVLMAVMMENQAAFQAGQPLPHFLFSAVSTCCYFGGTGNTIGLCLDMFTAKSEKFKAMRGIMTVPNIFNINEPVIFGVPVMLNPIFFIPMILSAVVPGVIAMILCSIIPFNLNPTIMMPWVTPAPISALFAGGPVYMLILLVCIASSAVLYYPFFKVADNQAYEEEQAYAAEHAA